ncbi:putative serine protease K12H4.7 [Choristoneura fumiferana]|uniref:putative serine protease K12H4.7 n=1 Tax=Choristoneura fumiferana TaxID=7141 RepID=UPI003D15808D
MYFIKLISALIVINFGFSCCFVFFQHRGVLEWKNYLTNKNNDVSDTSEEWIEQPLDHFNTNNETWKMRYYKRLTFWKPNGPIYLLIGGHFEMFSELIERYCLFTCQLANETNGALFLSEHRYYGESMPVDIIDTSSMKYLSSKQALADLAALIKTIKSAAEFKSSKVVVIGGSYAGNLAAWMRLLYPDLVDAAVSSSAPVLAKKDFYEYLEAVSDTYEKYGSADCVNKINDFFKRITELLKTPSGIEKLKKEFGICHHCDMRVIVNQQSFLESIISFMFGNVAAHHTPDDIKNKCRYLLTEKWKQSMQKSVEIFHEQLTSQYSSATSSAAETIFKPKKWTQITPGIWMCYNYSFKDIMHYMRAHRKKWYTVWAYQACTEFGYFDTTNSDKQPYAHNVPLDYYIKQCQAIFGEDFNEKRVDDGVAETNAMYGGITPKVTNVVFTHGDMDPWRRLGVLKDLSDTAVVRITNGTSNSALLYLDSSNPALLKDREYVKQMIKKWIEKS